MPDNEEQKTGEQEQNLNPYMEDDSTSKSDAVVSDESKETQEGKVEVEARTEDEESSELEESPDVKAYKESPAFKNLIDRLAQSKADKSTATYRKTQWRLESERDKTIAENKKLSDRIQLVSNQRIEFAKWADENPETVPKVRDLQEAERHFYDMRADAIARKAETEKLIQETMPRMNRLLNHESLKQVLGEVYGDDLDKINLAELSEYAKDFEDCDSDKMRAFVSRKLKASLAKGTPETVTNKVKRPAPTTSSGVGGKGRTFTREQIGKMSPEEFAKNEDAIFAAMTEKRIK